MPLLRSALFNLSFYAWSVFMIVTFAPALLLPWQVTVWGQRQWARGVNLLMRAIAGIDVEVRGRENLPPPPFLLASKHQSAWETMALQFVFPPQVQVVKRELLFVPFFGWGLASLNPIAIDRAAPARALRQVLRTGCERIADGWCVLLFPEGTRTRPGEQRPYMPSAAALALRAKCPLVPVAHNAGVYWSRNAMHKFSGTIELKIGEPLYPDGRSAAELTTAAAAWVEQQCAQMPQSTPTDPART